MDNVVRRQHCEHGRGVSLLDQKNGKPDRGRGVAPNGFGNDVAGWHLRAYLLHRRTLLLVGDHKDVFGPYQALQAAHSLREHGP